MEPTFQRDANSSLSQGRGTNLDVSGVSTAYGYNQLRARHSGKRVRVVSVVGASTADAVLLEQRSCGTAAGFQWSRS